MPDIYEQHKAAFSRVSAYVVLHNGVRVATVAFKFPADGAGRLYAYVHWIGVPMIRGFAGGYGYDKRTAAVEAAARKMCQTVEDGAALDTSPTRKAFHEAIASDDGSYWDRRLEKAGFTVLQAV